MVSNLPLTDHQLLRQKAYQCLLDLATEEGINASGKDEVFGCIFGRDSALTVLKILRAHKTIPSPELIHICRRALLTLVSLQGKELNIESGEEPGKFIHEFRKDKYDHLINRKRPWFIYPDGILRNYDSIDSTPLILIAIFKYWQAIGDNGFLVTVQEAVEAGLNWLITYGDIDKDVLIEYEFSPKRQSGGLTVHSWTDSRESLLNAKGEMPKYPIAPIEAQGYAWLALKLWADFYALEHPQFARKLLSQAQKLKERFNKKFIIKDKGLYYGAQALDGDKGQLKTITANPLLILWAAYENQGKMDCIIDKDLRDDFVKRGFLEDLFEADAGIRTMSTGSPTFNPNHDSYHNGSFWPILNGMVIEGLENFGFSEQVERLTNASLLPLVHFGTPIELYIKHEGSYAEYRSFTGQVSCRNQAWSAATIIDCLKP